MKKSLIYLLTIMMMLPLLLAGTQTDLDKRGLKGRVKSLEDENHVYYFNESGFLSGESYDYMDYFGDVYYSYDAQGHLSYMEDEDYYEGVIYAEAYEYNDQGLLIKQEISDYGSNTVFRFSYDAKGNLSKKEELDSANNLLSYYEYQNDANGKQIKSSFYKADKTLAEYTEYKYDAKGNKAEEIRFSSDKKLKNRYVYTYSAKGLKISETGYGPDGKIYSVSLAYDVNGNEVEYVHTDAKTNKVTKTITGYVYDEKGNWTEKTTAVDLNDKETVTRSLRYYED